MAVSKKDNRVYTLITKVISKSSELDTYLHYDSKEVMGHLTKQDPHHYKPTTYTNINR